MSQKHGKFSRNREFREDKVNDKYCKSRRPLLYSSGDVERMADERARAKLIRQLVSKPLESSSEFSSYFCGPNQLIDPVCSATSHTMNTQQQQQQYTSLISNVRWNPRTTVTMPLYNCQKNEKQYIGEGSNFTCRCKECGGKHCRGQLGEYKSPGFRDNITRFADNSTMTPKLNDACCGSCTPVAASRKISEVSVSGSDIAVRENHCPVAGVSQVYINSDPVSILKKKRCESIINCEVEEDDNYGIKTEKKCRIADDFQEAVRDTEDDVYYELNNSKLLRSFPKVVRNKPRDYLIDSEPRKNIYNEGISDFTIHLLPTAPVYPERCQTSKNLKSENSKTYFLRKSSRRRDDMPLSHNAESRYHYSCISPQMNSYHGSNDIVGQDAFAKKFRKTYSSKPMPYYNTESVKFPRKVLTSDNDIESYVGGRFMNASDR